MSTTDLVVALLSENEWSTFEAKRAAVQPRRLLETVCAFANKEGGLLVIGLEDPKKTQVKNRLIGISENRDNVAEFCKLVRTEFEPPVEALVTWFEEPIVNKDGTRDELLIVNIHKSQDIHSLKNGDTFVRNGNQNDKIGSTEIVRLRYEKGAIKFEEELSKVDSLEELDTNLLKIYKNDTNSESVDDWQFLKDNGLAKLNPKKNLLTKAGVLLFGKNPTILLSGKYGIKISHYYGTKANFSGEPNLVRKPFTVEGPLMTQISTTLDYFNTVVSSSPPKLSGSTFKPSLLIPERVFQEAVTNAVIHRNYNVQNDIQIRFFDDKIEIESPGTYPGHITVGNIRRERFARNPMILRTLNRFQSSPNLDIGEGVDRMFKIMKEHRLYDPVFFPPHLFPNSVMLFLPNQNKIGYWDTISHYLDKNSTITNEEARKITGITDTLKMSRLFAGWVEKGVLIRNGTAKKNSSYSKPGGTHLLDLLSEAMKIK